MLDLRKITSTRYDVIIIGGGGSGLMAGIMAAKRGLNVAILSKVHPLHSHTSAAQGGINAALGNQNADDWRWHVYDTLKGGDWLCDQDAVETMCKEASEAIMDLVAMGVEFNRDESGKIDQKIYGGQSSEFGKGTFVKRACYVKDATGSSIIKSLYEEAIKLNIHFLNYHFALDLIMDNASKSCLGVIVWDIANGIITKMTASNTIVATGGYSQIYATSTSSSICTGDGNGLIARAGLYLQDMEFIQFHPTAIPDIGILITEAARAAGGKLLNKNSERFMSKYAPEYMELASRDVVSRAIFAEIIDGNGCGEKANYVFLDLTHLSEAKLKNDLPTVWDNCQNFLKINPATDFIPVAPAAHYTMGGIPTNKYCQVVCEFNFGSETIVHGLYSIGEAACMSVHGANRLGCNSLLELIVSAKLAVNHLSALPLGQTYDDSNMDDLTQKIIARFNEYFGKSNDDTAENIKNELKLLMQKYAGLVRREDYLSIAIEAFQALKNRFYKIKIMESCLEWNNELQEYLELENLLIGAELTLHMALLRHESRGAHYREDFLKRDDKNFRFHMLSKYLSSNELQDTRREVRGGKDLETFLPKERKY